MVVDLDNKRRRISATGVAGKSHFVFLARHQAGNHLAQRTPPLQKGDQILILRLAIIGERAWTVEVNAVISSAHPTRNQLGLDVAWPRRCATRFKAWVHNDDVALVTLDNGNSVIDHRSVARRLAP